MHVRTGQVLALVFLFFSLSGAIPAWGQESIEVRQLRPLSPFDTGLLGPGQGGLPNNLWQNSNTASFMASLEALPPLTRVSVQEAWIARALLSAGLPPKGAEGDGDIAAARLRALLERGRVRDVVRMAEKTAGARSQEPLARVWSEASLALGDYDQACSLARHLKEGRTQAFWMRLRALCHVFAGEVSAAEVTAELAHSQGEQKKDTVFEKYFSALVQKEGGGDIRTKKSGLPAPQSILHWAMAYRFAGPPTVKAVKRAPPAVVSGFLPDTKIPDSVRAAALERMVAILTPEVFSKTLESFTLPKPVQAYFEAGNHQQDHPKPVSPVERSETSLADSPSKALFEGALKAAMDQKGLLAVASLISLARVEKDPAHKREILETLLNRIRKDRAIFEAVSFLARDFLEGIALSEEMTSKTASLFALAAVYAGNIPLARQATGLLGEKQDVLLDAVVQIMAPQDPEQTVIFWEKVTEEAKTMNKTQQEALFDIFSVFSALGKSLGPEARAFILQAPSPKQQSLTSSTAKLALDMAVSGDAQGEIFLLAAAVSGSQTLDKTSVETLAQLVSAFKAKGFEEEARRLAIAGLCARHPL